MNNEDDDNVGPSRNSCRTILQLFEFSLLGAAQSSFLSSVPFCGKSTCTVLSGGGFWVCFWEKG